MALAPAVARDDPRLPSATPAEAVPLVGLRRSSRFIPELESVRGIAVLLVFAFHVDGVVRFPFQFVTTTTLKMAFVHAGHTGVDLFFVLSAFLLSLPFLAEGAGGKRVVVRDFFKRRALRILPLYWSVVVFATALCADHLADLRGGVPYLAFLNSFPYTSTPLEPYSGVWWSLATEAQFYLLLPLLALFLRSRWGRAAGVAFLGVYALAYLAIVRGIYFMSTIEAQMALLFSVFARGPLFLWGIAAAEVYRRFGDRLRERLARIGWFRNGGADLLLAALIVANAFFLRWVVAIGSVRQMGAADQWWHIVNGALWATFVLLILLAPLRTKRLFSNAVLARFGILSYSIYLIHAPFMREGLFALRVRWPETFETWSWTLPTSAAIVVLSATCFGLSALTYRFIEQPFLVRKGRIDS